MSPKLGINIDHVATLRQLRGTPYPDLMEAARLVEKAGADQITVHLREDRRHIQDADVKLLKKELKISLNLEMAVEKEMVQIARKIRPDWSCLVPEKRKELTTEGGLDVEKNHRRVSTAIDALKEKGIRVSCFIEPNVNVVRLCHEMGADAVELHTGTYCLATQGALGTRSAKRVKSEFERIRKAAELGRKLGIHVHAGHGFDYQNVQDVVSLQAIDSTPLIEEYNIGHAVVCRAVFVGLEQAVREMKKLITSAV